MRPKPTKGNAPAAETVEASGSTPHQQSKESNVNSNLHPNTTPALSFSLDEFQLRVSVVEDDLRFVATDVCKMLGIGNPSHALARLDDDEKGITSSDTLGGVQSVAYVTESGFYTLILRCRDAVKPGSMPHRVRRWVTGDVIPAIRKTGGYSIKKQVPPDRQKRLCRSLMLDIAKCDDKFSRDGLIEIATVAFSDAGLNFPDTKLLRPLQMPIGGEGGAS